MWAGERDQNANSERENMDKPTCKTCPYWIEPLLNVDDDNLSCWRECQRFPPSLAGDERRGRWLKSFRDDTCGEHPDFPAWIESQKKPPADS
jgi:hypothetical protein